ncbi:MAG: response regulator [Planctomycetota bacterium]
MSLVTLLNAAGALLSLGALGAIAPRLKRVGPCIAPMLALLLAAQAVHFILVGVERAGVWGADDLDAYSDALGAILPLTWFFLFYGFVLDRQRRAVDDRNARLESALNELEQAQECLMRDERLRAMGEMAAGVAHDFNNRLTLILSNAELLQGEDLTAEQRRLAAQIVHAGEDAAAVVRRMNDFYRPSEAIALDWIDGERLLSECRELTRPRWSTCDPVVDVRIEAGPKADFVGCETELSNAVTNLIFNALDALPEGGNVVLRARASDAAVVIEVVDNGIGMDAATADQAVEPFFSNRARGTGTGLGLSIVRTVAEGHGGRLELESELGRGTTARLVLPMVSLARQGSPIDGGERDEAAVDVLVVDDNPPVRQVLRRMLEADGHRVLEAEDAASAYETVLSHTVDVVLLDRVMPVTSGDEAARQLKDMAPDLPVVMMTGHGDLTANDGFLPPGVDVCLDKPISRSTLHRALATVCRPRGAASSGRS